MLPGPPSPSGKKGGKRGSKKKGRKKKGERGGGMYEYLPMNNERGPVSSPSPTSSGDPPLETMTPESRAENGQADPSASPSDSGQVEVSEAAPNSLSETTGFQGLSGAFGHEMANSAEEDEDEEDAIAFRSPNLPANIAISSADPAEDDEASPSVFQSAQGRVTPGEGDGNSSARRLRAPQTPVSEKGGGSLVNAGASQSLGLLDDFRSAHSEEDREGEQMDDEWRSQVSETASAGLLAPPSPQNGAKTKETDMQNGDLALE
uniref:Uncharacterized protein n=1 Tax=Chromera velia CCMP2878 TaxID=1169474 RepID=A0A0G4HBW0_9ALVE|eukprot:Cvel_26060.t1-p1 / transcript=Cvel_26060.t1 / gene=Cvel_26060 / organism=Chromera_velia_CCMP2878 / gene_product=hypothetical protein / transcript_product=hypothetical protein / location=Cvel_scaffold3039:17487-18857(-) / protein_length=261 / sequence_SO=supercontig / SO=protein_coding / is_pseudo=false